MPRLASIVNSVDRNNIDQCKSLLHSVVSKIIKEYQVSDPLSKGMIAANGCSIFTALLTQYDSELANFIEHKRQSDKEAFNYVVSMRKPATVLQHGKAVCGGIAGLEQELAIPLKEFGIECYNIAGYTRNRDNLVASRQINHSWTVYLFCDNKLWAASDATNLVGQFSPQARLRDKIGRSSIVVVDPLLRDIFSFHHNRAEWKVGFPGKTIAAIFPDLCDYSEWLSLNETHKEAILTAQVIEKRIRKEDAAKLK